MECEMGGARSMHGDVRMGRIFHSKKPVEKISLGSFGRRWDNIKMDLKDTGCKVSGSDSSDPGEGPVAGSCEVRNKLSDS
jgi:hypothetical protein